MLLALAAFWGQGLLAQRFFFENLSNQQGLPDSKVNAVVQDNDGLVWIGTKAGLANYDGEIVTSLGTGDGAAAGGVRSLALDREGRVWAGHFNGGISICDRGRVQAFTIQGLESDITGLVVMPDERMLLTTVGQGAWAVRPDGAKGSVLSAERIGVPDELFDRLLGVWRMPSGKVLIIEEAGKIRTLEADGSFGTLALKDLPGAFIVTSVLEDSQGGLWVGTFGGGAFRFDGNGSLLQRYDLTNGLNGTTVMCFAEDLQQRVWVGTSDGGLSRVQGDQLRRFDQRSGLHDTYVRCLARDREGNLLIGTDSKGLDIFKGERFISFTEEDGLADPQVYAILEDDRGRTWIGTDDGIVVVDQEHRPLRSIRQENGDLGDNYIRCLEQDERGYIWIGTVNSGLERFGPGLDGSSLYDPYIELNAEISGVTALETGQPGELWIGATNGLWRYVPGSGTLPIRYSVDDGLAGDHVNAILRDSKGTLWVGTTVGGVTRMDNGKAKALDLGRSFSATCFVEDVDGDLWVGTEGQGVIVLHGEKEKVRFTTAEGLLSNTIKALGRDKEGHIWIGTNKGLNKWRPKKGGFITFTERAGFTGIEVKPNAVCATQGGDIWFGTANGATKVGGQRELDRTVAPVVFLRRWEVNTEDRDLQGDLELGSDERKVKILYGSVSLSDPGAVRYQYRLNGLDDDWQPVTRDAEAYYPALVPGSYTFEVKAMDRAGEWSAPASLSFTVLPPWWRRWWAITLALVLGGSALFGYIKIRERQLLLRNQVLERKVEERTAEVVKQSKEIEHQKGRIEDLLLNILPKQISDELRDTGKATARNHQEVTVMFTDIKGFTQAAERMTPEQLVSELDLCFIRFDEVIGRYGIEKIKTIGDSYMCACGVPTSDRLHAHKTVLAALEVRD
ncbi:MAG: hypothetical protein KDB88_09370, partial [Flavobacteriales bacterium]|nr:hypothetical protein [Flavobacteriales bacterium]